MRRTNRTVIWGGRGSRAAVGVLRFELRALVITILASALILTTSPMATPAVHAAAPRVVIVVGPVGSLTDRYRADGESAAKAARAAGATVETIYSPNATWPVVRDALQGASLVVYLGHGNGWPSRYRNSPFPKTQNGLGLNPEAGVDDEAHQYFGEAYLARDVRLAPHAVVLLVHLCYASGNSEPGVPEGDLATAQQRVDNFAAGWLATGAEAVIAEGYGGPAYYVRRILAGDGTVESIWRQAPTAHDHVLAFPSVRTPGMTGLLDPTRKSSGFYRSLVARAELRADEVARGAALAKSRDGIPVAIAATPVGPTVKDVTIDGVPTVASSIRVTLKLAKTDRKTVRGLGIGVRWDPIVLDPASVVPGEPGGVADAEAEAPSAEPAAASPAPSITPPAPAPSATPASAALEHDRRPADVTPSSEAAPDTAPASPDTTPASPATVSAPPEAEASGLPAAPPVVLISPEVPGAVVDLADVTVKRSTISAEVATPEVAGLYRLVVTLHGSDGAAFSTETQERIPAFTVRVMGELSAVVSAVDRLSVVAGAGIDLPVTVANTGHVAWVSDQPGKPVTGTPSRPERGDLYAALVGRWMRLDGSGVALEALAARATITPPPGASQDVMLSFSAPVEAGTYLLVLDVVSPLYGSLMAVGGSPMVVRVEVKTSTDEEGGSGGSPADGPRGTASSHVD